MAYVMLKGEKDISDVVGRAYGDLKAADARRAEAALLRANPQLAKLRELGSGTIIVVPAVPGLKPKATDRTELPTREALREVAEAFDAYRKRLDANQDDERTATAKLASLLKFKDLKALLRETPESKEFVDRVATAVKARIAEQEERAEFLKALTKARADLDELARKLG